MSSTIGDRCTRIRCTFEHQFRTHFSCDVHSLCTTPGTVNLEPPEHADTDDVLIEEVDDHVSIASIRPVPVY